MPNRGRHSSEPGSEEDQDPSLLRSQNNNYQERCVDPPEVLVMDNRRKDSAHRNKAHPKDSDGQGAETVGFIAVAADEPGGGACSCGRCRSVVCRVLTCGLYRVCQRSICAPCLNVPPPKPDSKEHSEEEEEEEKKKKKKEGGREREEYRDEEAWDFYLDGVQVDVPLGDLNPPGARPRASSPKPRPSSGQTGRWSYGSVTLGDWRREDEDEEEDEAYGGEGVDALIQKKLLALFTEYQIEELARCTTDSLFMRKSREISQLISSLAEEHQLDEQEAEGRLVRGIIRISTRRSRKGAPPPRCSASEHTLSDSGNETMRNSESCSNNNDYKSNPNFQISDVTHSDMYARNMRMNNSGRRSGPYTDTVSSGVSVTRTSMRT